jgi:hypothetical protein
VIDLSPFKMFQGILSQNEPQQLLKQAAYKPGLPFLFMARFYFWNTLRCPTNQILLLLNHPSICPFIYQTNLALLPSNDF